VDTRAVVPQARKWNGIVLMLNKPIIAAMERRSIAMESTRVWQHHWSVHTICEYMDADIDGNAVVCLCYIDYKESFILLPR
jgi:hypothetical protein